MPNDGMNCKLPPHMAKQRSTMTHRIWWWWCGGGVPCQKGRFKLTLRSLHFPAGWKGHGELEAKMRAG